MACSRVATLSRASTPLEARRVSDRWPSLLAPLPVREAPPDATRARTWLVLVLELVLGSGLVLALGLGLSLGSGLGLESGEGAHESARAEQCG